MVPYTLALNRKLVTNAFRKTELLADVPQETLERVARYSDLAVCRR